MTFKEFIREWRKTLESRAAEYAERGEPFVGFLEGKEVVCSPDSVQEYFKEKAERLAKKMRCRNKPVKRYPDYDPTRPRIAKA